jgi:hypothetical protein
MDADERDICLYLKGYPGQFVSYREISLRAGGKHRYRQDPDWASQVLSRLVERRTVESDATGHYRLKKPPKTNQVERQWVSPEIKKILEKSGKKFEGVLEVEEEEGEF